MHGLNDAQHSAVTSLNPRLLVLAGAGCGKTRVLVHRIAWLVQDMQVSPYSILAVTFTNRAAFEMRTRIESLLSHPAQGLWVGTFHSIAHRLLRKHAKNINLNENFQIIDADDQLKLIKNLAKEANISDEILAAKEIQWFINGAKDRGERVKHVNNTSHDKNHQLLLHIYQLYENYCFKESIVDFNELLLRTYELFRDNSGLRTHYQQRFQHILVDEFQDTNTIQYEWIKLLLTPQNNLTVVGDDDQSIYGWRGAQIENILSFNEHMENAELIRLERNYRSTSNILNAANAVIACNSDRLGKELWTQDDSGEPIGHYHAFNEIDEAKYVTQEIKNQIKLGINPKNIAILYRSNAQSRVIEDELVKSQLPYKIFGGLRFFDR